MIASTDLMAADATAARMMSHDVNKIKQLTMGRDMGLGRIDEEAIDIVGEKLSKLQMEWKQAEIKNKPPGS